MACEWVRDNYGVPAEIGRRVIAYGKPGVIAEDRGNYIGINLDEDKPGVINNYHPVDSIEYKEMGKIRKMTKAQQRYKRFLEYGDSFDSFIEFCRWDSDQEKSCNGI